MLSFVQVHNVAYPTNRGKVMVLASNFDTAGMVFCRG
jgi:hypothetical protein